MNRFEHRTAVVTGAASGIGAAIASALHSEGARVVWIDRDPAVEELAHRHDGVGVVGDVSDTELPGRVLELIRKQAEGLDHFGVPPLRRTPGFMPRAVARDGSAVLLPRG